MHASLGWRKPLEAILAALAGCLCKILYAKFRETSLAKFRSATGANFSRCEVAPSRRYARSARRETGGWATGCFETHVSSITPPGDTAYTVGTVVREKARGEQRREEVHGEARAA